MATKAPYAELAKMVKSQREAKIARKNEIRAWKKQVLQPIQPFLNELYDFAELTEKAGFPGRDKDDPQFHIQPTDARKGLRIFCEEVESSTTHPGMLDWTIILEDDSGKRRACKGQLNHTVLGDASDKGYDDLFR